MRVPPEIFSVTATTAIADSGIKKPGAGSLRMPSWLLSLFLVSILIAKIDAGAATTVHPNPILAFSFDNVTSSVIQDDSGSGNTYSIVAYDRNGPFTPATARSFSGSGQAMDFDGTQRQRIEINGPALTVQAFTIMADIRLHNPPVFTNSQRWEISEKAGSYWANIRVDQGFVRPGPPFLLRVGGFFSGQGNTTYTGVTAITAGPWQNVAFVFDNVAHTLTTYVNGVFDHSEPQTGTLDPSIIHNGIDENLVVGAKHRQGGTEVLQAFFDGEMDNYRLFDVALLPAEIGYYSRRPVPSLSW